MANSKGVQIATPKGGESIQHIHSTKEERAQNVKQFREQKDHELQIKNDRFAKINERRKKKGAAGSRGINVEVTSDS